MKITNIIYSKDNSGASIAVKRINQMFLKSGYNSNILSFIETKKNNKLEIVIRNFLHKVLKKIQQKIFKINISHPTNFGFFSSNFYKKINNTNSQIINLHWIGNEMMSIKDISKINGFIIWTLHDMWPYCAIENYMNPNSFDLNYSFKKKKLNFFLDFFFQAKIKHFSNVKLVICTSKWQKELCEKSLIYRNVEKKIIPLPLNFETWSPKNKVAVRKNYKIPKNRKIILFILSHKYAAKRKGLDFVVKYFESSKLDNLCLITTNCNEIKINNPNLIHYNFNNINSIDKMIDLYSMSDLLLMPSRLESFGQTILEAQACNCPAITFKNTGCEDLVEHLKNGYLSEYMNQTDFANGIEILLQTNFQNQIIRNSAKEKYSEDIIGLQYKEILQNIFKF